MTRVQRFGGMVVLVAVLAAGCTSTRTGSDAASGTIADTTTASDTSALAADGGETEPAGTLPAAGGDCLAPDDIAPWTGEVTAQVVPLQEATDTAVGVDAVVYPRPDHEGRPWSQWGQGIVLDDGRLLSAIGDHQGVDGNSYLYVYDPSTGTLTQIGDALSLTEHVAGEYGFGKIHAQMVPGACGLVYTSTYWGSRRGLQYTDDYHGDLLVRIDPQAETIGTTGVLLPEHGTASMAAWQEGGLLYAEAADPFGEKTGSFVALDATTGEVVFRDDDPAHGGYRSIAVDTEGRAYVTWGGIGLARFDPAAGAIEPLDATMPGDTLRAATVPDDAGTVYAVTRDPAVFFAIEPDGTIREVGSARGYTASMALAPEGDRFFYVPDAHGGSWEQGTPLIAVDTATGEEEVIVELNPLAEEQLGLRTGGSYSVAVDPSGDTVYVGLNAGDPDSRDTFGEILLVVVTLP